MQFYYDCLDISRPIQTYYESERVKEHRVWDMRDIHYSGQQHASSTTKSSEPEYTHKTQHTHNTPNRGVQIVTRVYVVQCRD